MILLVLVPAAFEGSEPDALFDRVPDAPVGVAVAVVAAPVPVAVGEAFDVVVTPNCKSRIEGGPKYPERVSRRKERRISGEEAAIFES